MLTASSAPDIFDNLRVLLNVDEATAAIIETVFQTGLSAEEIAELANVSEPIVSA